MDLFTSDEDEFEDSAKFKFETHKNGRSEINNVARALTPAELSLLRTQINEDKERGFVRMNWHSIAVVTGLPYPSVKLEGEKMETTNSNVGIEAN
jgi:hypothetical protein